MTFKRQPPAAQKDAAEPQPPLKIDPTNIHSKANSKTKEAAVKEMQKPEISIFDGYEYGGAKEVVVKAMQKRLEGSWQCVSTHANGGKDVSDVIHTIKGDEWDNTLGLRVVNRGTYKLVNLNTSPKQIDYVYEAGELKGKTLKGIFMLDGDSLIVAFGADARPKVFFTEKGDPDPLVVRQFRRQQAK